MNAIGHEVFVLYHFGSERIRGAQAGGSKREQRHRKTICLVYNSMNFQHLSLIARLFNPAFVNHNENGAVSGLATVIGALPSITFTLSNSQIGLQFVRAERAHVETRDPAIDTDLRQFIDAAPSGIQITWGETLMLRLDTDGKLIERWQAPFPTTLLPEPCFATLQ